MSLFSFSSFCVLSTVDSLLDPDNRLHLSTEEQLKALLEKLDMVASMRSSGGRTKRIRLLRREINTVTHKQQRSQSHNGKEEEEEEKGKKDNVENSPLTSASTLGKGKRDVLGLFMGLLWSNSTSLSGMDELV